MTLDLLAPLAALLVDMPVDIGVSNAGGYLVSLVNRAFWVVRIGSLFPSPRNALPGCHSIVFPLQREALRGAGLISEPYLMPHFS